jgi:hypothetical protein
VIYNHNTYINKTTINRTTNYNNYHPWNRNGQTTAGTHPYSPNGGRTPANTPNGGENGNHGLIGGRGGVEQGQTQRVCARPITNAMIRAKIGNTMLPAAIVRAAMGFKPAAKAQP